ncbi:MAG: hypothetical protein KBS75_03165, partial [Bacteroidales bacterium]|nr:hypothetical protein [Candidatus Equimonas faecalis]
SNSPAEIRMFVLGEDEEATSIMQQITQQSSSLEGLYDITGRPMNNAVRGLYIHNGKKNLSK